MASPDRPVTLTVFMEGTSNPIDTVMTQIAFFGKSCDAISLNSSSFSKPSIQPGHYKVCFAGVGVTNGFWGVVLASGLKEQTQLVSQYAAAFVEAGLAVKINFVGLSRGGIGGIHLALELADFAPEQVLLNLLLYDPVPGDFVFMSRYLGVTFNACQAMDMSHVGNIGRLVMLYPHEPLPAVALHAPVIPRLPKYCNAEIDVILGCHQGALFMRRSIDTCLSFSIIREFLLERGSRLNIRNSQNSHLIVDDAELASYLDSELRENVPTTRCLHASVGGLEIVRHPTGQFLNRRHQELLRRAGRPCEIDRRSDVPPYMLDVSGLENLISSTT